MRILIVGPPGAGKGTLAETVCENYRLRHISTGDMFRSNIKKKTELGLVAGHYIEQGLLVPDEVTNAMVERLFLDEVQEGPFLLDGYPRTIPQAEALDYYLSELGIKLDAVIELAIPDDMIIERLAGRRVCSKCGAGYHTKNKKPKVDGVCDACGSPIIQREDDNEETIKRRLEIYHEETSPLIDFYNDKGLIAQITTCGSIAETYEQAQEIFSEKGLA